MLTPHGAAYAVLKALREGGGEGVAHFPGISVGRVVDRHPNLNQIARVAKGDLSKGGLS